MAKKKKKKKARKKMNTTLTTLEDFNKERARQYLAQEEAKGNGIACPECGSELLDNPLTIFSSMPPQIRVYCGKKSCGFLGTRVK